MVEWRVFRWLPVLLLGACASSPAMESQLDLFERFDLVAFRGDDRTARYFLWRWERPLSIHYIGPEEYRQRVYDHAIRLGALTGREVILEGDDPNLNVEITDEETGYTCMADVHSTEPSRAHIHSDLPPDYIRQCIVQEMTQALGLFGDLDGYFSSRGDTVFASHQTADDLTDADIAMIRILYDDRLHHGMRRFEALPIIRQIVTEMEAEAEMEAAGRAARE